MRVATGKCVMKWIWCLNSSFTFELCNEMNRNYIIEDQDFMRKKKACEKINNGHEDLGGGFY